MNAEETVKKLKARGAVEVADGTGTGFEEEPLEQELPADLAQELSDLESRQHDQPIPSQHAEVAQEVLEGNLERVRKFKFDRQDEVTDFVPGRMMTSGEFLRLLRTIDPSFFYNDFSAVGLRGLNYVRSGLVIPLTSVQDGMMIEWSQLRTDEHGIGTNERFRGWRTCLMSMIDKGALTEADVHRVFGAPTGPRAKRWFRNLFLIRHGWCRDCESKICVCRELGEGARADNYARPD